MFRSRLFTSIFFFSLSLFCRTGTGAGAEKPSGKAKAAHGETAASGGWIAQTPPGRARPAPRRAASAAPNEAQQLRRSVESAARETARSALRAARTPVLEKTIRARAEQAASPLPTDGPPGEVRLVCMTTSVIEKSRWIVPKIPLPPFYQWNKWLDRHAHTATHSALDWKNAQGEWWHTEMRGYHHHPARYRVGQGEFQGSGVTIYGIFLLPGRTNPEKQKVLLDEKITCDYRIIEAETRKYARKNRRRGEPGTGGRGLENVGLGGPAFKPSQNSNTYISYLLRKAGVHRAAPPGAIGWDKIPHFPYSSDADAYPWR